MTSRLLVQINDQQAYFFHCTQKIFSVRRKIILLAGVTQIGSFFVTPSFWHEPNDQMARAKRSIGLSQTTKWLYRKIANEVSFPYLSHTIPISFLGHMSGSCPVHVRYMSGTCPVFYRTSTEHQSSHLPF